MQKPLVLDTTVIAPGSHKVVELPIARLTSGIQITLPVHVFHSKEPGPVILLSGGLHGDEINGIETVRQAISGNLCSRITRGSILAIPIINVYGFLFFSRDVPDGKDVNRSFPGSSEGSLASIVAHVLTTKILPLIDFGLDFHTGGSSRTNFPQLRYAKEDAKAVSLAHQFGAPFSIPISVIQGSLRATAYSQGIPLVVFEGGESLRLDHQAVKEAIKGIKRVLAAHGMREKSPKIKGVKGRRIGEKSRRRWLSDSTWVRAESSGLFTFERHSGLAVEKGEMIGRINNPYDSFTLKVFSPIDGFIIGHNNMPVVHKGDALFHIAAEMEPPIY